MSDILLLASSSKSRQLLLREVTIPFKVIPQSADELSCDWTLPLPQVVRNIAALKMDHAQIPVSKEGDRCFVLTADTLCLDKQGNLQGKPTDYEDGVAKIKASRGGARAGTAFCLDRKLWKSGAWHIEERIEQYVEAYYEFEVPDHWVENYIKTSGCLETAGAIVIEGYGQQFLKRVEGSYSTIIGLPLFEGEASIRRDWI